MILPYVNKECTNGRWISRSGRTENLEYSLMKILWAFIAAEKFINLTLIFNELAFNFNWQLFSSLLAPEVMHVYCTILVVQLQDGCNPGGISLSGTVTFVGRRS